MHAARFAADWEALWPRSAPVGLAVSGGPDSLALLLLAHSVLPGCFQVATVDHGLRAESAAEACFVGSVCRALGIRHDILTLSLASGPALQKRAREARYAALGHWVGASGLNAIVTAHHADDQAETLMMRLARGAGVRGLAAMRGCSPVPGHPEHVLLRPLLGWRRSELAAVVAAAGIQPILDPSNTDQRFERARMRARLSRALDLDPTAMAASARYLGEADAAIEWAAERSLATVQRSHEAMLWSPGDTPRAIALRVLERIVVDLAGVKPRGKALARWHDQLSAGGVATLAGVRCDGRGSLWRFSMAPLHRRIR